jgi:hypothetical protein
MKRLMPLNPATYQRHLIHGEERIWPETNCHTDILIELLHALKCDPVPALPFTFCIDFEGDQWTFFKFPHQDLFDLYGLEIKELNPWRPLWIAIEEQISLGHPVLVELDSYFLPDTNGSAYKLAHVKSTVAVNEIDLAENKLGYFHNQGYFDLQGQDFIDIFQTKGLVHDRMLPPYVEFITRDTSSGAKTPAEILEISLRLFKKNLARVPKQNPFIQFKTRFVEDLKWLMNEPIEAFHLYSFANLRQYGACFELCATYLNWLKSQGIEEAGPAAEIFLSISSTSKGFQFQLARAMTRRKELDLSPIDMMGEKWETAMGILRKKFA